MCLLVSSVYSVCVGMCKVESIVFGTALQPVLGKQPFGYLPQFGNIRWTGTIIPSMLPICGVVENTTGFLFQILGELGLLKYTTTRSLMKIRTTLAIHTLFRVSMLTLSTHTSYSLVQTTLIIIPKKWYFSHFMFSNCLTLAIIVCLLTPEALASTLNEINGWPPYFLISVSIHGHTYHKYHI